MVLRRALLHIEEIIGRRPELLTARAGDRLAMLGNQVRVLLEGDAVHHLGHVLRVGQLARRSTFGEIGRQEGTRIRLVERRT